jgi:dihydrofolate reductase
MPRIVNSTFISLDGIVNHMDRWHFDFIDDESNAVALEQLAAADGLLLGRKTYEIYASAWPTRDGELAKRINVLPKYVASTTLTNPDWENSTVLDGDLITAVTRLDGTILMHGYGPVARTLLAHNLLDELHLWVHPVLAGVGEPNDMLFQTGQHARLHLAGTHVFQSGIVMLSYHK